MIAGAPAPEAAVPAAARRLAAGRPVRVVWENELGGLTFEIGGAQREYVKWQRAGCPIDLDAEAARLWWAGAYTPVPRVLARGRDAAGEWLVTTALPGRSAVDERWRAHPGPAVAAVGAGLRALHDALPTATCPFDWSAGSRVRHILRRGVPARADRSTEHRHLSPADVRRILADAPSVDRLVVCHGDACAPNTLIADDGSWCGHVDLGALGVADRWADLAVATWSTQWNYGPGWESALLEAYGIEPDERRIAYYRLLWDLAPD
jgi:kanamycin kinase